MPRLGSRLLDADGSGSDSREARASLCILAITLIVALLITALFIVNLLFCMQEAAMKRKELANARKQIIRQYNLHEYDANAIVSERERKLRAARASCASMIFSLRRESMRESQLETRSAI